jgi:hypothetical protein
LLAVAVFEADAQSTATTSSPYSKFGIGDITPQWLPQNIAMGGISTATNVIGQYNSINILNPASYGKITYTVIDAGFSSSIQTLSSSGLPSERDANMRYSHLALAFPVSKGSALSFGLLPYSEMGYKYKQTFSKLGGTSSPVDTNAVNYVYSGDGGLSKAYLGYGFSIGKHLTVGANASYIFGNLKQIQSTEIPNLSTLGFLNSSIEQDNHVGGFNFDYGAQYTIDFSNTRHLILGYSASVGNKVNEYNSFIVSQYYYDAQGQQNVAADSLVNTKTPNAKLQLPRINHFGIVYQKDGIFQNGSNFLVGVDYTASNWSNLAIDGVNANLQNSKMFNIGGQITPNPASLSSFWALIDYRLGFIYEDTYLKVNGVDIKNYAATFGFGIPLPHDRASSAFYKVNFAAEIGQRGTIANGLVKENYVNLHLGFTLNDRWFQRYKFD